MKTPAFLLLAMVNLIHCQDQEQTIVSTLQGVLEKLEVISNKLEESHQEIKSFVHDEISRVISLAETDECSEGGQPCGDGTCQDTLFSFTCSCPPGFTWDGSDCADIDECLQGKADCNRNHASCKNSIGSYSCSCNPPFVGDGRTCSCPLGFALNGDICEDIDECAEGKASCHPNAVCKNSNGSYSCSCNKPLWGDGKDVCEFRCKHPVGVHSALGCVERVYKKMAFQEMKEFCHEEGGRILQHINEDYLFDIEYDLYDWGDSISSLWIGVYDEKWMSDESPVPEDLWVKGYRSDPSRRCGILEWDSSSSSSSSSSLKVNQISCSRKFWGYCQFLLP